MDRIPQCCQGQLNIIYTITIYNNCNAIYTCLCSYYKKLQSFEVTTRQNVAACYCPVTTDLQLRRDLAHISGSPCTVVLREEERAMPHQAPDLAPILLMATSALFRLPEEERMTIRRVIASPNSIFTPPLHPRAPLGLSPAIPLFSSHRTI